MGFFCVSNTYLIKMFATEQENSCSFSGFLGWTKSCQNATMHCLLASYYLLFFTPFSNKKIRENEVANSQSSRLCSAPTSMTVLKRLRPFGSSLWHYLSVQKAKRREADSPYEAEAPRPPRPSFVLFIRELLPVLNSTVRPGLAAVSRVIFGF